ncbi:MAG: HAD-IA family hydrolase [Acidobacteria bacterium]|nr:HAD-IA family hydrolase [Acidobacteriota bacterium]MDW7983285.1 HAD-IA family hydrolase [Acidobacteriota bacterium]
MAVRAVFLDFVGTLAFVEPDVGTVYADVARAFGLNLDAAAVERAFAQVFPRRSPLAFPRDWPDDTRRAAEFAWWRAVVADTLRACGVPIVARGEQRTANSEQPVSNKRTASCGSLFAVRYSPFAPRDPFEAYFAALYETFATPAVWRLDPAALEVLKTLRQKGLRVGVISNFDSRLPVLLERLGLTPWLDVIVYSSAVGAAKPEVGIFLEACRQAGVAPAEALHVGDDPELDYWGARRAGLHARWRVHDDTPPISDIPAADRLRDLLVLGQSEF